MFNCVDAKYLMFCNFNIWWQSFFISPTVYCKAIKPDQFLWQKKNVYIKPSQRLKKIVCVNNFAIKLLVKIHIFLFVTENFDSLTESPWVWSWTEWMKLGKLFVLVYFPPYTKLGSVFNFVLLFFKTKVLLWLMCILILKAILVGRNSILYRVHIRIDQLFVTIMVNHFWNTTI